jgi:type III pantothenate kinase
MLVAIDAVAAFNMYGGPAVVVDCGTATVFDAISQNGEYLGGSIAAGARLSADALFSNTSQLKRVELLAPEHVIGKSTTLSLQSGLVLGNVYMIEGMVKKFAEEMNTNPIIIGTGGLSTLFSNVTDIFDHVNENLTLEGLRIIYNLNM